MGMSFLFEKGIFSVSLALSTGRVDCAASPAPVLGLLPPGSTFVQSGTNSCRESCALQFLRIIKEMLENIVKIDVLKIKVSFSL